MPYLRGDGMSNNNFVIIGAGLTPNTTQTRILYNADNDGCGIFLPNDILKMAGLLNVNEVKLYKNNQTKELVIAHPASPAPSAGYIQVGRGNRNYSLREPNITGIGKVVRIPKDVAITFGLTVNNQCKYSVFENPLYLVPKIDAQNRWIIIKFP